MNSIVNRKELKIGQKLLVHLFWTSVCAISNYASHHTLGKLSWKVALASCKFGLM